MLDLRDELDRLKVIRAGRVSFKPLDRHLLLIGDSRTANCIGGTAPSEIIESYGHASWYGPMSDGSVRISASRKGATPGHTTKDCLDNLNTYIAMGGEVCPTLIGTNDFNNTTIPLGTTKRNVETILKKLVDAGKVPIVLGEAPRGGAYQLTDRLSDFLNYRDWLATRVPDLGIRYAHIWDALIDPANAAAGLPIASLYVDMLHWNTLGAYEVAKIVAPHIIDLFGVPISLPTFDSPYDATYNRSGWLNLNPTLLGTAGTRSASANATGVVADSCTLSGSSWTGATAIASKETNPDGGEYQVLTLGGTPTLAGSTLIFEQTLDLAKVTTGDIIRGLCKTVAQNLSGVSGISTDLRYVRGGTAYFNKCLDRYVEGTVMPSNPADLVQETPYLTISGDTEIKLRTVIYGCQNVPISGVVKIGNFGCEKII